MNHIIFDLITHSMKCEVCKDSEKVVFPTTLDSFKKKHKEFVRDHLGCQPHQKAAQERLDKLKRKPLKKSGE